MTRLIRILIVEDDPTIADALNYNLSKGGYQTSIAVNGDDAMLLFKETEPDVVLLDWMLPHYSGIELLRMMRKRQASVAILMLTARDEEEDRIRGLKEGADDYLAKPFSMAELMARVEALLRRARHSHGQSKLEFADLVLGLEDYRVLRGGASVHLGPTEFRLLEHLMRHPRKVFSREQLLAEVWGPESEIDVRTVDVHIRRLRRAINNDERHPDLIRTVRSAGYSLDDPKNPD